MPRLEYLEERLVPTLFGPPIHNSLASAEPGFGQFIRAFPGDFTNDGKADLAVIRPGNSELTVLRSTGNGTFLTPLSFEAGRSLLDLVVADFNKDLNLDFVVTDNSASTANLFVGNGNGTFRLHATLALHGPQSSVDTGDFNQDGNPDLLTAAQPMQHSLTVAAATSR